MTYTVAGQRITDTVAVHGFAVGWFGQRSWSLTTPPGTRISSPDKAPAPIIVRYG